MSLVNTEYCKDMHPALLGERPSTNFLNIHIKIAERELRDWVGDTAYEDAASQTPTDTKRAEALKDAEAELVVYFALDKLNLHISSLGVILSSIEKGQFGTGTIATASPSQLEAIKKPYYNNARHFARDYIIGSTNVKPVKVAS